MKGMKVQGGRAFLEYSPNPFFMSFMPSWCALWDNRLLSALHGVLFGTTAFSQLSCKLISMVLYALVLALAACVTPVQQRLPDKASLTPAQKKIDSPLLQEIVRRADPAFVPGTPPVSRMRIDGQGRALVDVRAEVTLQIRKTIADLEGAIVSAWPEYHSIEAWVPFSQIEVLAAEDTVTAIRPVAEPATHR
jgi:hypothetical protein